MGPKGLYSEVSKPEGQAGREQREASYSPKAGTALLSRPVRTMFTVGNTKRSQWGAVALGVQTSALGQQQPWMGTGQHSHTPGCISSSHRARPRVLPETSPPTWSCWDARRGGPSWVSGTPILWAQVWLSRPLLLLPMPADSNSRGKRCVSVFPLQLGNSCVDHAGSAWIRALPSRGPDPLEESL